MHVVIVLSDFTKIKYYFGIYRAPMPLHWRKRLDLSSFRSMSTTLAWSMYVNDTLQILWLVSISSCLVLMLIVLVAICDFSSGTPATATRCCRLCTSADRFGRRSWLTAVSLGGRRTCSPAWPTCSTVLPTRRGKWASYHPRSSSHGYARRMVREK